jgi:hypothetical protein
MIKNLKNIITDKIEIFEFKVIKYYAIQNVYLLSLYNHFIFSLINL